MHLQTICISTGMSQVKLGNAGHVSAGRSSYLLFSISCLQQGAASQQQSGLSPIGILWQPAENSWLPLLLLADLDSAGSPGKERGL